MQDFRPNEDHLSNMRVALQGMLVQHADRRSSGTGTASTATSYSTATTSTTAAGGTGVGTTIAMFPAWPCDEWSVDFKVHLPLRTTIQGSYNHTTKRLVVHAIDPPERRSDIQYLNCVSMPDVVYK